MLTDNSTAPLLLVVEDDGNHADLIMRSFEDYSEEFRLVAYPSIKKAMNAADTQQPALVLTDFRLPDGYGSDLVTLSAGRWPVILMTSHGNEQIAVDAMKIGAQDYLVKSAEAFEQLPRTVVSVLKSWGHIQARKQAEKAALCAKEDWENTFNAVPDLIAVIDTTHTILRVNKAMADRCGINSQKLVGRKCHEVVHGHKVPHCDCPFYAMLEDGMVHSSKIEENKLDGAFEVTVSPLVDNGGRITGCVHVMRDITERKRAEEERQRLEQQFQQAQKLESLGVLAGGIAHDFNNILTIILGHCFIVRDGFDSGMSEKEHVEQIEKAANRAAELCRQMLAYAGASPLQKTRTNLVLLVDEIVKMLKSAIKKNITIALDLKQNVPEISGDIAQIQQVVMNLIINAAEAIGENNGTISVVLMETAVGMDGREKDYSGNAILPGCYACLEVSDTGCGIDVETRKRIFEPFFTTKFTGRGLGMSAVLGIIRSHDGALQLESTPGAGTSFKVYIPLTRSREQLVPVMQPGVTDIVSKRATILLVDDELALLNMEKALFEVIGYSVLTAGDGREALELFNKHGSEISLVKLDQIMPVMGGVEAYRELRALNRTVPVIICSGYGAESVADVIAADTRAGFINKPYNPTLLRRMLADMLGE